MPNTTSFELSKQLYEVAKAKGYELPPSNANWVEAKSFENRTNYKTLLGAGEALKDDVWGVIHFYPSYTTDELLAGLPVVIVIDGHHYYLTLEKWEKCFRVSYKPMAPIELLWTEKDDTPSNALCKLYIYLIDNDLMPEI